MGGSIVRFRSSQHDRTEQRSSMSSISSSYLRCQCCTANHRKINRRVLLIVLLALMYFLSMMTMRSTAFFRAALYSAALAGLGELAPPRPARSFWYSMWIRMVAGVEEVVSADRAESFCGRNG